MKGSVSGVINFSADSSDGGCWSNTSPELTQQKLLSREVEIRDASSLDRNASLQIEGFTRQNMPLHESAWQDAAWLEQVYLPAAAEMVKDISGADYTEPFLGGSMIRDSRTSSHAPPATFAHLDFSRQSMAPFVQASGSPDIRQRYPRAIIFNVWRPITEPPQNPPLALCHLQTVEESNWVVGRTLGEGDVGDVEYLTISFNPSQCWYFYPELDLDEVIVFKGADTDPQEKMGCFHTAFSRDDLGTRAIPRASIEMRVIAFFNA